MMLSNRSDFLKTLLQYRQHLTSLASRNTLIYEKYEDKRQETRKERFYSETTIAEFLTNACSLSIAYLNARSWHLTIGRENAPSLSVHRNAVIRQAIRLIGRTVAAWSAKETWNRNAHILIFQQARSSPRTPCRRHMWNDSATFSFLLPSLYKIPWTLNAEQP